MPHARRPEPTSPARRSRRRRKTHPEPRSHYRRFDRHQLADAAIISPPMAGESEIEMRTVARRHVMYSSIKQRVAGAGCAGAIGYGDLLGPLLAPPRYPRGEAPRLPVPRSRERTDVGTTAARRGGTRRPSRSAGRARAVPGGGNAVELATSSSRRGARAEIREVVVEASQSTIAGRSDSCPGRRLHQRPSGPRAGQGDGVAVDVPRALESATACAARPSPQPVMAQTVGRRADAHGRGDGCVAPARAPRDVPRSRLFSGTQSAFTTE